MTEKEQIKAEIERRIKAYKTKNGFPAGRICAIRIETYEGLLSFIDSLPEEKPSRDLDEAAKEYASKTLCDPDDGPSVGLVKDAFKAGWNCCKARNTRMGKIDPDFDGLKIDTRRFAFLSKQAGKDSILNPYIESMRRQIERKIADMPPAPEGYRYSWKLEDFSREGDSFSITSNIVLKPIDPERDEHNSKLNEDLLDAAKDALLLERAWLTLDGFGHEELAERLRDYAERKGLIWK